MLWLIPLLLLCFSVRAQDDDCQQGHEQCGHDDGDSTGASDATASSTVESNIVIMGGKIPKKTTVRNVPSPDTPNIYPSAPCRIARSVGFSFAGGALSGGHSVEDPECTLRETVRTFQYLGVPEVGLILLCKNSVVIIGRKDKKGKPYPNERPIGTQECLRLVREFQGGDVSSDTDDVVAAEVEILRQQQDSFEQQLTSTVERLERSYEQHRTATRTNAVVQKEIIHQPYLNEEKRSKLAALFGDNNEET